MRGDHEEYKMATVGMLNQMADPISKTLQTTLELVNTLTNGMNMLKEAVDIQNTTIDQLHKRIRELESRGKLEPLSDDPKDAGLFKFLRRK